MALPNGDWTTKADCIEDLVEALDMAEYEDTYFLSSIPTYAAAVAGIADPQAKLTCQTLYAMLSRVRKSAKWARCMFPTNNPDYCVPYFFDNYAGGTDYELTAGKIMAAWIDADQPTRLMTVMTIDELRREAWNQEFFSFKIAPAGGG